MLATTQALARTQAELYGPRRGLYAASMSRRRTPDGFSAELHREIAMHLQRTVFEEWRLQQFLPVEAPNDPQPTPQGRA